MKRKKILVVFGTRPEAIKMAPVVKELRKEKSSFQTVVCVTGQHRHMLDQVLKLFKIRPDMDLNLMQENQSLPSLTARALVILTETLQRVKPDLVLVQGDTTTAMVAALAAFYQKIPVGHVEAGLRTHDIYNPFPEEVNRCIISAMASFNFAPTRISYQALIDQGISKQRVLLTGNTVVDALRMIVKSGKFAKVNIALKKNSRLILVTAHRRENFGRPLEQICDALNAIVKRNPDVEVVYPVHLNPNVKNTVYERLAGKERIHLIAPTEYDQLVYLIKNAYLILTDSGGIQEEAPAFGKPVLVMREETERPEGIEAGVARLVGTNTAIIVKEVEKLLTREAVYNKMSRAVSPYGDGKAAERIIKHLKFHLG
ncbi:MAG TPA: UDP-N-acetylglucosamine 2-epimerase (non-hydrolyzing) [Candidatus Omnitrophota bacterium]|nr:UDP-N-acetylglucosamine 2-epimerase (non-hydrolyzing) [Candidatus Omnitrophota bacterium]